MGRVVTKKVKIDTFNQSTTYAYNLDGSVNTVTYPTARVLSHGYNGAARPTSLTDTTGSINYVSACQAAPCYSAGGALLNARFGVTGTFAGITLQNTYNNRLQPTLISATTPTPTTLLSLTYDFHLANGDNGNVFQIANGKDANRTQNFLYDSLNRIQQAYTTGNSPLTTSWGEAFTIDAWGNLTNRAAVTGKTNTELLNAAPASTKNQLNGFCNDSAGNLVLNSSCPLPLGTAFTPTYSYDAENRLISAGGYTYSYDGDGNRVKKTNGSTGTIYWRDASGEVIVDANLAGTSQNEYIFFGGKRIARRDVPTGHKHYYFSDHLGSASVITSDLGVIQEESDYYPYGGEIPITNGDPNTYKFTGKEHDTESGLDYFGARYDASSLGRFMTPDSIAYSGLGDPQSLNLYNYVGNHPSIMIDPDGRCWKWLQPLCNTAQRFDNWVGGDGFRTNNQIDSTPPSQDPRSQRRRQQEANGGNAANGHSSFVDWWVNTSSAEMRFWNNVDYKFHRALCYPGCDIPFMGGTGLPSIDANIHPMVRVGRWMSPEELNKMRESGKVVESRNGGVTSVSVPPNSAAYRNAPEGDVFVEFDVPESAVQAVTSNGWGKIYGPSSIFGEALEITEMPSVANIEVLP